MHVPKVNLADPDVEPTDAELEALMRSVGAGVIAREARAKARFHEGLVEETERVSGGSTGSSPSADRPAEGSDGTAAARQARSGQAAVE